MAALPYLQLYVADYLADTMHLVAEEHGAYLLLIMNYWQTGKPLPNDLDRLTTIARLPSSDRTNGRCSTVERLLKEYFTLVNGRWVHPRIEADLEEVRQQQEQRAAAGRKSAMKRLAKKMAKEKAKQTTVPTSVTTTAPTAVPTEPQRKTNDIDPDPNSSTHTQARDDQPPQRFPTGMRTGVPEDFKPDQQTLTQLQMTGCRTPNQDDITMFIVTNQSSGWVSENWQAEFKKFMIREKVKQQERKNASGRRSSTTSGRKPSAVEVVEQANPIDDDDEGHTFEHISR